MSNSNTAARGESPADSTASTMTKSAGMPLVSVVMPLFNKKKFLERSLRSAVDQTYSNIEIMVVDDGSTDGSVEFLMSRFSDSRICVHRQPNAGPGAARNKGIELSKGKYIAFLDADDQWDLQFVDRSVHSLEKMGSLISCCNFALVENDSRQLANDYPEGIWRLPPNLMTDEFEQHLNSLHSAGCVLCNREIFKKYGGFFEESCTYGEDSFLWIKVLLNEEIYRISDALFTYHIEGSDLGVYAGGPSYRPPKPYILSPRTIRDHCPTEHRPVLEKFLTEKALRACHNEIGVGQAEHVDSLIQEFPMMRRQLVSFYFLVLKKKFPIYRRIKSFVRNGGKIPIQLGPSTKD